MRAGRMLVVALLVAGCRDGSKQREAAPAPRPVDSDRLVPEPDRDVRARELARRFLILDGHVDVPHRLIEGLDARGRPTEDLASRTTRGDFDFPRATAGGLDAPFMSIYVPSSLQKTGGAKRRADQLIDLVEGMVRQAPDKFAIATSPDQIAANSQAGRVSLPLGIENGAAIEDDLANLAHFHRRGVRYITLTHGEDNLICDSSYSEARTWKGLSPFGEKVVAEMNRLGIMVDVSHISDQAFDRVLAVTRAPVIASHSSARHFTPGFERNLDDARIKVLAAAGGVVLVNFGSSFIDQRARDYFDAMFAAVKAQVAGRDPPASEAEREALRKAYAAEHPPVYATVEQVADHIEHIARLVGVDHVGFGSDFDGVGDSLPTGLKDVSQYPNLIRVLLERGWSEADIEKVCGGNLLRVWRVVEDRAREN